MSQPPILSGPPSPTPPPPRNGCLQALAILAGIVLLLPGICVLILAGNEPHLFNKADQPLVLLVLAIGAGGVALIWWAVRRRPQ